MSRDNLALLITVCLTASAISTYETLARKDVCGSFATSVRIESDRPSPIRRVHWDTSARRADVQTAVAAGATGSSWHFRPDPVRPTGDGTIKITGRVGGEESPLGLVCDRKVNERFVILKIDFEDGSTVYRWAEVNPKDRAAVTVVHIPADE